MLKLTSRRNLARLAHAMSSSAEVSHVATFPVKNMVAFAEAAVSVRKIEGMGAVESACLPLSVG